MMAPKPKNEAGAKALLDVPRPRPRPRTSTSRPTRATSARTRAPTPSGYNALQKKSAEIIGATANIAQFLDRDTRPDFASTVMIPALQEFIKNPNDIDGLTTSIENQKKSIFV